MAEKAALSGKDSFLTCSEDLFEGFIRERLNSSTVNDEEETDTEQPIGDDEAEVIAGEDSSGDSTIGGKDKGKDGESSIDSTPSKGSASNPKTIIVSREKLNMKSFADNKVNGNAPSINVVKQLPTTRVISPKHDNGSTIFGSTQSSSGVFLVKSTEKGGKLNSKEVVLNNGKKVVVVSPKNLLVNGDGRSSPEPISTLAINKRIVGNKPVNVIQGADRKSLDVSGISSRLPGLFNGHVSKKMEVSVGADSRKNDSDDREPTSTLNVRVTALPDTHTFKKPIQLNGKKTIVNRKPIPVDSATHKKLLSMMNSNDERIIYVKKNAIRLKPISEHSVQCVVDASNNNVRELATEKAGSEIQRIIMASEKAGSDIQKIMNYQETDDGVHDAEERLSNSSQQLSPESKQKSEQVATVTSKGAENDFAKELAKMYMKQLTNRAVPVYEPQQPLPYVGNMLGCAECNDKFTQQSSLDFHRARRSVLITYSCTVCDRRLSFFNRCSLLRHLRGHQRKITNIDFSSISIKPIPDNLIKLSNTYGQQKVNSVPAQDTAAKKPSTVTQSNSVSTNANSSVTRNSVSIDSNNGVTKVRKVHIDIVGKKQLSPLSAENNSVRNSPPVGDVPVNNSLSKVVTRNVTKQVSEFKTPSPSRLQTTPPKKENSPKIVTKYHPDRRFKTCPECKVNVGSDKTLQDHLLNTNKPNNPYLRCNDCQLILPTRCSLRMHLRMHIPIKPYRCPECGVEYEIYERFMLHLEYECFHLAKVIRFTCTLCDVAEPSLNKLRVHVLNAHTRRIYKCFHCTMAFLSKKLIIRHQNEIHANVETRWNLFSQCKFCPEKMIPQNKFANHIAKHITDENFKLYMYECYECKKNFLQKKALAEHLLTCASNKKVVANGVSDTKVGGERDFVEVGNEALQSNTVVEVEDEVEVIVPERGASTAVEEDDVCERDPLSLEGFQVEEQPVSEPQLELCVLCKKKRVVIEPGVNVAQQSLCCRDCVRPCGGEADLQQRTMITRRKTKTQTIYRCKLCNFLTVVDYDTILRHLRRLHREVGEKDTKHFIDIEKKNIFHSVRSKTVSTADSIKDKYLKKRKVTGESVQVKQEPMDVDENDYEDDSVTTNERVVKKKSLPKAKMPITSGLDTKFDRGLVMEASQPADSSNLQCCKCSFVGESIQALRGHVAQHRTDRSAMQCLECGECFVVLPSLEKHLAIRHHIHNVEQYIAENPSCAPLPPDDVTDTLECSVCLLAFESKQELDKHTRIHGMAFLQQARTKS